MANGFLTNVGLDLFAQHQGNNTPLIIDRFLLANIPGLDPSQENNLDEPIPDSQHIIDEYPVNREGYVTPNQVVYSLFLGSQIGDFTFNWVGLLSENGDLVAARYISPVDKIKSAGFGERGNTLTRNFLINYNNAQSITNITVEASTWQIQFDAATQEHYGLTRYGSEAGTACEGDDPRLRTNLGRIYYPGGVDIVSSTGNNVFIGTVNGNRVGLMHNDDKNKLDGIEGGSQRNVGTHLNRTRTATTITVESSTGNNTTLHSATETVAGLMTAANQSKLNGIQAGAEKNVAQELKTGRNDSAVTIEISGGSRVTLHPATSTVAGIMSAAGQKKLNDIEAGAEVNIGTNLSAERKTNTVEIKSSTGNNVTIGAATNTAAGVMTVSDRQKMTSIEQGAEVNVPTNLSVTRNATQAAVNSSTGSHSTILAATTTVAGVMTANDKTKLDNLDNVPSGAVVAFARPTPPTGWLRANGATISRSTYAAIFASIGTRFGSGNGSTTFRLPDLRGEFIRGLDDGRNIDTGRVLGSVQLDAIQNISGVFEVEAVAKSATGVFRTTNSGTRHTGGNNFGSRVTLEVGRVARVANETRPRNIALLYCIKI